MALHRQDANTGQAMMIGDRPLVITATDAVLAPTDQQRHHQDRVLGADSLGAEVELAADIAADYYRKARQVSLDFARKGGNPERRRSSVAWKRAEDRYEVARRILGALIELRHRDLSHGRRTNAIITAQKLVESRVDPICMGFERNGELVHHPTMPCPVHQRPERPWA